MLVSSSGSYFHLSFAKGHFFIRFSNYKKHQKKRKYLWNSLKMQAHNKGPQAFFFRFQIANSVVFWPNFLGDFWGKFWKKHGFTVANSVVQCRSRQESASRLPVEKKFPFIFLDIKKENRLRHVSKIVWLFSSSLFCVTTS